MKRITSRSRMAVIGLLTPGKGVGDERPPRGLTVRGLIHHARHARLRLKYTVVRIVGNHLISLGNLIDRNLDYYG